MIDTRTIWSRFGKLPRAARWAILAVVGLALFLTYDAGVRPVSRGWNDRAEAMLADVRETARAQERLKHLRASRDPILALGPVEIPDREAEAGRALNEAVNEVLKEHPVSRDSFSLRSPAKLKRGTLERLISSDQRVERITGDLRFVAGPEEATAIIAALEKRPEIESISSVRITRKAGRKVTLDLTVDVWIVTSQRKSRGGGA